MAKSPALIAKLKSFSDKLSGGFDVDNQANPDSALNKNKKDSQMQQKAKPFDFSAYKNAKSYGTGVGP